MSGARRDAAIVFGVALLARLGVVAWTGTRFPPAHDGVRYDALAGRLAEGHGYTWLWPDGTVTSVAHYPVGYPAALAVAYRLFGHHAMSAGVESTLVGALAALAAWGIVHSIAPAGEPRSTARLAGLAIALHPGLVLYTPALMTEGLTAALITLTAWAAVVTRSAATASAAGRAGRLALVGVLAGAAGLVRPQTLVLAPLFGAVAAGRRGLVVCTALAALTCAPWVARNCATIDRCTLSTNSGWNLLIGAQQGASGGWQAVDVPPECKDVFGESATDACFGRAARADIAAAPLRWLALAPRKLAATFDVGGIGGYYLNLSNPRVFPWSAVLAAGAVETLFERIALGLALLAAWRSDGPRGRMRTWVAACGAAFALTPWAWVTVLALCVALAALGARSLTRLPLHTAVLGVLASTAAVHAAFFGAPRYALVAAPLVTALATVGLGEWRSRRRSAMAGGPR